MEYAYQPEAWHELYLMVGTAAAGLTGLIFVAVSLHLREVLSNPWHRGTAGSSLLALMSVVLISGALLAPPQPLPLLGAEIAAIALLSPAYDSLALLHLPRERRAPAVAKVLLGMVGGFLAVAAGVSLAIEAGGGLWLLLPAAAIALGSAVLNAWRLMVDVAEGPAADRATSADPDGADAADPPQADANRADAGDPPMADAPVESRLAGADPSSVP
jgi:hypothetical protein